MYKINHPTRLRPFNYGYVLKHDWEYRKALRQCRKNKKQYGVAFDNSEAYQMQRHIVFCFYDIGAMRCDIPNRVSLHNHN